MKFILSKLTWKNLRSVGNSPIIKATILVPIIGYVIILNETIGEFIKLHSEIDPRFDLGYWKLVLIYYGFLCVGLASFLYQICCPFILKKYDSPLAFVSSEASYISDGPERSGIIIDIIRKLNNLSQSQIVLLGNSREQITFFIAEIQLYVQSRSIMPEKLAIQMISFYWYVENYRRRPAVFAAFALYIAGFAFLAVPATQTFISVTFTIVRRILG